MQELRTAVRTGQYVRARGDAWMVLRCDAYQGCALVTLRGSSDANGGRIVRLLAPFDRLQPVVRASGLRASSRHAALGAAARVLQQSHAWSDLWTAARARIDLLAWQLAPAHAVVAGGATRVLLADAVGLGKTIQAGLIIAELRARGFNMRTLVLTPASLREQWATELADRFGLPSTVLDHATLADLASELPPDVNPWSTADIAISSIDLVKRPEVRAALESVAIDVLVVDEAHHLTPGTDRGALIADLAARTPWVVLVTATPHSGDERAYAYLTGLGAVDDALVVFRRAGADVGRERTRRVHLRAVPTTAPERALFDDAFAYAQALWRQQRGSDRATALIAALICRRATSSTRALINTLSKRRQIIAGTPPDSSGMQRELPWLDDESVDDGDDAVLLAARGLDDRLSEIEWLDRLIARALAVGAVWSKAMQIEQLLSRVPESIIVFSEFRDSVEQLAERLAAKGSAAVLHGGMSARERGNVVRAFTNGGVRVLLATDAAGEGLNLQARCRLVINLELPWSPLRLEQRIGRVDRVGQTRRVHAWHLYHRASFEAVVLRHLRGRAARASACLANEQAQIEGAVFTGEQAGSGPVVERVVAATLDRKAINGPAMRRRAAALVRSNDTSLKPPPASCAVRTARTPLASGMLLLFECVLRDGVGRAIATELVPVAAAFARPSRVLQTKICSVVDAAARHHHVQTVLHDVHSRTADLNAAAARRFAGAVTRRLRALDRRLVAVAKPALQRSLFDRRAEQQACAREFARTILRRHLADLSAAVVALNHSSADAPRLVAAWPIDAE